MSWNSLSAFSEKQTVCLYHVDISHIVSKNHPLTAINHLIMNTGVQQLRMDPILHKPVCWLTGVDFQQVEACQPKPFYSGLHFTCAWKGREKITRGGVNIKKSLMKLTGSPAVMWSVHNALSSFHCRSRLYLQTHLSQMLHKMINAPAAVEIVSHLHQVQHLHGDVTMATVGTLRGRAHRLWQCSGNDESSIATRGQSGVQ